MGFLNRIAERAAKSDAHERFAAERGLSYEAIGTLPDATPGKPEELGALMGTANDAVVRILAEVAETGSSHG